MMSDLAAALAELASPRPRTAAEQVLPPAPMPAELAATTARTPSHFASSGKDKQIAVESDVRAMCVSAHTVWMAHADGNISVRKTRTAEVVAKLSPYQGRAWCLLTVMPTDGVEHVWVGLSNGDIEVYDATTRAPKTLLSRHTGGIYCMTEFSGFVFSGSNDFEIMQWDITKKVFLRQLSGHTNYVRCLFAEGGLLISGSNDHTVRVWNIATGKNVATARFHAETNGGGVGAVCRVGQHVWSADESGAIIVWALETMQVVEKMAEHTGRITSLKKVGSRVYSGAGDCEILVWDAATRRVMGKIDEHRGWINSILCPAQLSRYYLWTSAADGTVKCWHHDEYRVMSADSERFDDMRWYHTEHTPYKDLNICLSNELTAATEKLQALQINYFKDIDMLRSEGDKARAIAEKALLLEGHLGSAQDRFNEKERELKTAKDILSLKEKELSATNSNAIRLTRENGDLKVANEKMKAEIEDLKRRLELAEIQKEVAEGAVKKIHGDDAAGRVLSPLIIRNESEASIAAAKLYKELEEVVRLNESFRDEIIRYKTLLGINNHTPRIGDAAAEMAIAAARARGLAERGGGGATSPNRRGVVPRPPDSTGAASTKGSVAAAGDGYLWRGAHFTGDVKSYVNDKYFSERVLFHNANASRPLSPRVPSRANGDNQSCKCFGTGPRRLTTKF